MQKKTNNSNTSNAKNIALFGASLAAVAGTAYFFFGPKGKKRQQHAKSWAIKMKADVVEKLETAKDVTEPIYRNMVDSVAKKYAKNMKIGQAEIDLLAKDLKKHWKIISASAKTANKTSSKTAKK